MKQNILKKGIAVLTVIFLFGVGANAFAGWGRGYYGAGPVGQYRGWGGYDGPFYGRSDISEEDWKKLDQERQAFLTDTEVLRRKIYEKEMALRSELAKSSPDAPLAAGIRKELSDLQAEFEQKRLSHMIKMREVNPNFGRGDRMGRGRGYGRGYRMDGPGPRGYGYGPGACWR